MNSISAPGLPQRLPNLGTTEHGGSRRVPAFLHRTLRATWGRPPPPRVGGGAGLHPGLISSHQTPGGSGPPQPTRMSGPRPASGSFLDRLCQEHGPDPRSDGPGGGLRGWACPPSSQLSWAPISLGKPLASEAVLGAQVGWVVRALVREKWRALSLPGNSPEQGPASRQVLAAQLRPPRRGDPGKESRGAGHGRGPRLRLESLERLRPRSASSSAQEIRTGQPYVSGLRPFPSRQGGDGGPGAPVTCLISRVQPASRLQRARGV